MKSDVFFVFSCVLEVGFLFVFDVTPIGAACYLTTEEAQSALNNGTIGNYCPHGQIRDRGNDRCIQVASEGTSMPFYNNCYVPFICTACYGYHNVKVDKECSPTQKQTCKCIDPSMVMVLSTDGERCTNPSTSRLPLSPENVPTSSSLPTTQEITNLPNPCISDPCVNDGTCVMEGSGFQCQCAPGWDGNLCKENIACRSSPCGHHGECIPVEDLYVCNCTKGFAGDHCDQKYNENDVSFWEILFTTTESYIGFAVSGFLGLIAGIIVTYKVLKNQRRLPWLIEKNVNGKLFTAADLMNGFPQYLIKRGLVVFIYDENRDHIREDLKLAKDFVTMVLGSERQAQCIKRIETRSPQYVRTEMKKLSETPGFDMFMCITLCHGGKEGMICGDSPDRFVNENELIGMFKGGTCEAFLGKPKVFLFTHCRGREVSAPLYTAGVTDNNNVSNGSICNLTDFLIVYSSLPLTVSFITQEGSWSMKNLIEAAQRYPQYDLVTILTEMSNLVVSQVGQYQNGQGKQQPTVMSMLRQHIYLNGVQKEPTRAIQSTDGSDDRDDDNGDVEHNRGQENRRSSAELVSANGNAGDMGEMWV